VEFSLCAEYLLIPRVVRLNDCQMTETFQHWFFLQGIGLIQDLIMEYGLDVVQAYMNHIQVYF